VTPELTEPLVLRALVLLAQRELTEPQVQQGLQVLARRVQLGLVLLAPQASLELTELLVQQELPEQLELVLKGQQVLPDPLELVLPVQRELPVQELQVPLASLGLTALLELPVLALRALLALKAKLA
jgi:hypothetical protein